MAMPNKIQMIEKKEKGKHRIMDKEANKIERYLNTSQIPDLLKLFNECLKSSITSLLAIR